MGEAFEAKKTVEESARFEELEDVIERWQRSFKEVGSSLREINESRLYRDLFPTFEEYVLQRWEMGTSHAYRQMEASWAVDEISKVSPIGDRLLVRESQARAIHPLVRTNPQKAAEVLERLDAEGGRITARRINEAVDRALGRAASLGSENAAPSERESAAEADAEQENEQAHSPESVAKLGNLPPRQSGLSAPVSRGPGSKWKMAPRIIDLYPEKVDVYVEPYVGTGAMILSKEPSPVEVVNDIHTEIANLFDVIRNRSKALARVVDRSGFTEADLKRAYREDPSNLDSVERARRWLVLAHQSFLRQTGEPSLSITTDLSRGSTRLWTELPAHIEAAGRRLQKVKVLSRDAFEVIEMDIFHSPDVLLYVDPPYLPGTRTANLYVHEMPVKKHVELLELLVCHPGLVYLSGYDSAEYNDRLMVEGWEARELTGYASLGKRREILWMNDLASEAARAAEERQAKRARKEQQRKQAAQPPGMGMIYQPPPEKEAPPEAAAFEALIGGWLWERPASFAAETRD